MLVCKALCNIERWYEIDQDHVPTRRSTECIYILYLDLHIYTRICTYLVAVVSFWNRLDGAIPRNEMMKHRWEEKGSSLCRVLASLAVSRAIEGNDLEFPLPETSIVPEN